MQPEPVSPELVLVDPELAARERARLDEKARLAELRQVQEARVQEFRVEDLRVLVERATQAPPAQGEPAPPVLVAAPRRSVRSVLVPAALLASLLVNGMLAAAIVVRADQNTPVAIAPVAQSSTPLLTNASPTSLPKRSMVERKLVGIILAAPAAKLPPTFRDPMTGLIRNNVRVTCRATRQYRRYLCAVRMPHARDGVYIRYRTLRNGSASFTWLGQKVRNSRLLPNQQ